MITGGEIKKGAELVNVIGELVEKVYNRLKRPSTQLREWCLDFLELERKYRKAKTFDEEDSIVDAEKRLIPKIAEEVLGMPIEERMQYIGKEEGWKICFRLERYKRLRWVMYIYGTPFDTAKVKHILFEFAYPEWLPIHGRRVLHFFLFKGIKAMLQLKNSFWVMLRGKHKSVHEPVGPPDFPKRPAVRWCDIRDHRKQHVLCTNLKATDQETTCFWYEYERARYGHKSETVRSEKLKGHYNLAKLLDEEIAEDTVYALIQLISSLKEL